ncbi:MAG: GxxExxY protein [Lewinellaceae bacterium]|nr:GxxExxY protein [Saprospiraceae bacterium]MCB9315793.1 GxxExxY protein [Lewinellaceae bacterium]MCB9332468.1 GxxExxY protein [Lewinellaceae bacterium]
MEREALNLLASEVVDAAFVVHKHMGPGLLESIYEHCLMKEFEIRRVPAMRQVPIPLIYRGIELSKNYVVDILVAEEIILELKAVEAILPVHEAQIISHLKLANKRLGFLLNFNVPVMKVGIKRFVNNF